MQRIRCESKTANKISMIGQIYSGTTSHLTCLVGATAGNYKKFIASIIFQ